MNIYNNNTNNLLFVREVTDNLIPTILSNAMTVLSHIGIFKQEQHAFFKKHVGIYVTFSHLLRPFLLSMLWCIFQLGILGIRDTNPFNATYIATRTRPIGSTSLFTLSLVATVTIDDVTITLRVAWQTYTIKFFLIFKSNIY